MKIIDDLKLIERQLKMSEQEQVEQELDIYYEELANNESY